MFYQREKVHPTPRVEGEEEIQDLRQRIYLLRTELCSLEDIYKEKLAIFQENCGKIGHDYIAERDDDYHNTRIYYVCKKCESFTRYK